MITSLSLYWNYTMQCTASFQYITDAFYFKDRHILWIQIKKHNWKIQTQGINIQTNDVVNQYKHNADVYCNKYTCLEPFKGTWHIFMCACILASLVGQMGVKLGWERMMYSGKDSFKGTVHHQKIFLQYVMLRMVTKNSTIIITKYTWCHRYMEIIQITGGPPLRLHRKSDSKAERRKLKCSDITSAISRLTRIIVFLER